MPALARRHARIARPGRLARRPEEIGLRGALGRPPRRAAAPPQAAWPSTGPAPGPGETEPRPAPARRGWHVLPRREAPRPGPPPAGGARAIPAGERGVAAVELALVMPFLAALALATVDVATAAARAFELQAAAGAGAAAVARLDLLPPDGAQGAGGANVRLPPPPRVPALSELVALPPAATGEIRLFWGCSGGQVPLPQRGPCRDGVPSAPYAEITVSGDVRRLVAWPDQILPAHAEARTLIRLG